MVPYNMDNQSMFRFCECGLTAWRNWSLQGRDFHCFLWVCWWYWDFDRQLVKSEGSPKLRRLTQVCT